eukprot:TRINITY_DN25_c1_g1_i2.p2 TRINITY_DN25_c1_g1~~TRINITY_DN25_c1_g1_i2.p2  ORF type:complete len:168 (-),score=1.02 TRINITY_DN25_c1_g1_i2:448-951(-)
MEPASMLSMIKGRRVAALLSLTIRRNPSFVSGQYPPNTHLSGTRWPLLYLRLAMRDSSIWTTTPGPPILRKLELNFREHISRKIEYQRTADTELMSNTWGTVLTGIFWAHAQAKRIVSGKDRLELVHKEPLLSLRVLSWWVPHFHRFAPPRYLDRDIGRWHVPQVGG